MRWLVAAIAAFQTTAYPPPFPRPGAVKLIDNDRVLVWDVTWPKGQPSAMHRHPYDMTGIYYWPGSRIVTSTEGARRESTTPAGRIQWLSQGAVHMEEGTSDDSLRAVFIELKGDEASGKAAPASDTPMFMAGKPLLDNARVIAFDASGASGRHAHRMDAVIVYTQERTARAEFVAAGVAHDAESGTPGMRVTVFELK